MGKLLRIIRKLFGKKREKEIKFYIRDYGDTEWREMKCEPMDKLEYRSPGFKDEWIKLNDPFQPNTSES